MFFSNLKIFLKQLLRSKMYSAVTILGFSISLMFVILLSVYIEQELSVDKFHVNKDRIFRLTTGESSQFAPPVGQRVKDLYPEIETYTRLYINGGIISIKDQNKIRMQYLMVDSSFFTMFSFKLIEGDPKEVFRARSSIVLSQSFAKKLFGNTSPIGKEIEMTSMFKFIVTGVIEDFYENTHIESCDALISFPLIAEKWGLLNSYDNNSYALYFLTKPNTNIASKESEILENFKKDFWMYKQGFAKAVKFEPLTDIYFGGLRGTAAKGNNMKLIIVFSTIAIIILILAIINYINLSVAQSSLRSKEVAVKKLHGSSKLRLFMQFITESIIICIIGFNVALMLAKFAEPAFNNLLNTHIDLSEKFNLLTTLIYLGGIVIVGIISGFIPAFVITSYKAIDIIKGSFRRKSRNVFGRILISFQYCAAITLIICTWIIAKQTIYMRNYDIGFNKDNIICFENELPENKSTEFRNEILKISGVVDVAFSAGSPLDGGNNLSIDYNGKPVSFQEFHFDSAFIKMFGIDITPTGTAITKNMFCLNETAVKELEMESLPKTFKFPGGYQMPVYGVVKDFHFRNLYKKIGPAIIMKLTKEEYPWTVFISVTGANRTQTVSKIAKVYIGFTGGLSMNYAYLDEFLHEWYQKEERTSKMIGYLSLLAIIISIMGILAMATFYINQRIKEIGIRKVNGATELEIVQMLNSDLIKWVLIAFVVACPIAYYASTKWLENFPYRTDLSWWIFIASGLIALVFALIIVSWQSWRAASRNPVEALRYE